MRFSAKEQYGLRAMVELARHQDEGPVSLAEVAQVENLSLSYLEQIVIPLRRSGLLRSVRGARGGYVLARPPEGVTVGDVIRALEGSIMPMTCVAEDECTPCEREGSCATRTVWKEVHDRIVETLESTTLADLC